MAFILNLLWSNWPRRVLTQFLTQLTSYYCSLVKSSRRRAVLHHKILPAVRAVFLSGRCSIRFQTIYAEVTQSGQIQGDGLACWSIGNSARISILMLHWVMVIKYETSMIVEFSLSVEFGIQPEHLFKHQIEFISNSAIPAKLASASLFAGQFRGDSTLIQTQFGFLISLPYPQSNLQSY